MREKIATGTVKDRLTVAQNTTPVPLSFTYFNQPPARYTFEMPAIKSWVEYWCLGKVLNLFAGKVRLSVDEYRVDIDKEMNPDYCGDAYVFVKTTNMKFDTIVFDPPYNLRKSREKYMGRYIGSTTKIKNLLPNILNSGGRVISLGYDSVGMSASRGFSKIAIALICHNGDHNDTICLVEEKILANGVLFSPSTEKG